MKKIEIEIPNGKRAEWVNGVLTLVDDAPQDVRERIKTLQDACNELGDEHPLVTQYRLTASAFKEDPMTEDFIAFLKLRIIVAALNEGWEPTFEEDESRWYPWFTDRYGGLVYASAGYAGSNSYSSYGMRLTFKSKELAEYAGRQFLDIYKDFCFKTLTKSNEQDPQAPSDL